MSSTKKLSDIERFKYKKMIKSLQAAKGNGTSMISLIIPAGGQISLYNKKLTEEFGTASNIKSRVNRLSVLSAITATQQRLKRYSKTPENGLVVYAGNCITEEGKEKKLVIDIIPWEPVMTTFYYCDSKFHTEPLEDILIDETSYGFIIIDGKDCLFANVRGNVKNILYKFSSQIKSKSRRGGQSALRFSRLREEQVDAHIKKACENANRLFLESEKPNISGIIIAGSANMKGLLVKSDVLDKRLKKIIIKTIDVSYSGNVGLNSAIEQSADTLGDIKLVKEKKLLKEYFGHIYKNTGLYCYSLNHTMYALEMGAIDKLIIWENCPWFRYTYLTDECKEEVGYVKDLKLVKEKISGYELLIDWFVENESKLGTKLELVTDSTSEGTNYCQGFGGIGGILRWKVNFDTIDEVLDRDKEDELSDDEFDDLF